MNQLRLSILSTALAASVFTVTAHAAAFQLYELGTPIIGTAGVGQAAVAEDASTAYFNPAGMTQLSGSQFMLGSQMLVPYANFSRNTSNTITGDNGGNAGSLVPGMDVYFAYHPAPKWNIGVSVTSPFGGALTYNDGWVGRYTVQNVVFYTINVNPSLAYQVTPWLALGAGAAVEYINLQQTVALAIPNSADGQAKVNVANTSMGYNIGLMLTPYKDTRIGIAYRSQIVHNMTGNTTFLRITDTPATKTKMVMPANIIVSAAQKVNSRFTLLGELGWANWSTMRNTILNVANYSAVTPLNWRNTYRAGVGGQWQATPALLLQLGVSYDTSPTTSAYRLPVMPMDNQLRAGLGLIYTLIKQVSLGASYEYINFGSANINNVSAYGVLAGDYSRNYANVLQVSLNAVI